jgi:ribosomal-protein-alanine N-acetyltransferase
MTSPDILGLTLPKAGLQDGTVHIREWRMTDLDCVREAGTDPRIPEGTTVPAVWSPDEGRAFIERQWSRQTSGEGVSLAIADAADDADDRAIGLIILSKRPQPDSFGVGYWMVPSARRRGAATGAVRLLTDWALTMGVRRVEAWVEPDNLASQRVLLAAGFELEGLLRSFLVLGTRRADVLSFARVS